MNLRLAMLAVLGATSSCTSPTHADAGPDASTPGAGVMADAGREDAGTTDAGTTDAGTTDAGTTDAGTTDAGPLWTQLPSSPPARTCRTPQSYPRVAGQPFSLGGQPAWFHDEGHEYGFFHTYDALVACAGAAPRKVHVLLPRDYETSGRRYPVLYVHDGQTAFFADNAVGKTWDLAAVLSDLSRCAEIEDLVVVAPHPLDRDVEFTHQHFLDGRSCCGVDAWTETLTTCIGGFIEANYRVETGPSRTAILGSSHGGLAAFWVATAHPERFGHVAALSPSLWVGLDDRATGASGTTRLRDSALYAHARPALTGPNRPAVWLDWGLERDGGIHNSIIEKLATERGRELTALLRDELGPDAGVVAFEDPAGGHDEDSWKRRVPWVLRWMFPRR